MTLRSPPTYIHSQLRVPSVAHACPLSLSCIIYPPQSRAQGRILGNQSSPPASSAKQIWYNSFRPISLLPFLPAGTLSQSRHPHCSAWVCPLASTWAQLQSVCDPTRPRELPQQKLCVRAAWFYLLFTDPHHPEDSLKFQAIQPIYVSHSASSHISPSTTPNFRVL